VLEPARRRLFGSGDLRCVSANLEIKTFHLHEIRPAPKRYSWVTAGCGVSILAVNAFMKVTKDTRKTKAWAALAPGAAGDLPAASSFPTVAASRLHPKEGCKSQYS